MDTGVDAIIGELSSKIDSAPNLSQGRISTYTSGVQDFAVGLSDGLANTKSSIDTSVYEFGYSTGAKLRQAIEDNLLKKGINDPKNPYDPRRGENLPNLASQLTEVAQDLHQELKGMGFAIKNPYKFLLRQVKTFDDGVGIAPNLIDLLRIYGKLVEKIIDGTLETDFVTKMESSGTADSYVQLGIHSLFKGEVIAANSQFLQASQLNKNPSLVNPLRDVSSNTYAAYIILNKSYSKIELAREFDRVSQPR